MRILIGIDDTDNLESRGTGYRSRQLAKALEDAGLCTLEGITRHQLLFDPRIPYTSHNSSACLEVLGSDPAAILTLCREFLLRESAEGSDAGLAVCPFDQVDAEVEGWGARAKAEILTQPEAQDIAARKGICLEGLTGTRDGIIGSLAAIGLRKTGNDGRLIGTGRRDVRELKGICTVAELLEEIRLDAITDPEGNPLPAHARIDLGDWARPVMRDRRITLIAEPVNNNPSHEWRVAAKEYIKGITG